MNVLFVCTGNTCRSPMAEKILKVKADKENIKLNIKSAGIAAMEGYPASAHAKTVLKDYGIDEPHITQRVSKELIEWADIVLTMTMGHKQVLMENYPEVHEKMFTLKEYVSYTSDNAHWDKLDELYAKVEIKKQEFLIKHQKEIQALEERYNTLKEDIHQTENELKNYNKRLEEYVKEELEEIDKLEKLLPPLDIQDPFGGNLKTYQGAAKEIEESINKFLEDLKKEEK